SPHVEQIRDRILDLLKPITPRPSDIHFYSTVTAERIDTTQLDADYWFRNLRSPVEFEATTRLLLTDGYDTFIESSPHPVLVTGIQETLDTTDTPARNFGTLRRDNGDLTNFLLATAHAFTAGATTHHDGHHDGHHVTLPGYPFQQDRYWLKPGTSRSDVSSAGLTTSDHPLLGAVIEGATSTTLTGRISLATHPWLADHKVAGNTVLPGAAFIELALHAADQVDCGTIRELTVQSPLLLPEHGALRLRVEVGEPTGGDGARPIRVDARPDTSTDTSWTSHATGILDTNTPPADWDLTTWPPTGAQPLDISYDTLATHGYHYGPTFQGLQKMWHHNDHIYA
ncbi:acyltransferase domain-containing protein, partial [Streptomyces sp. NPDC020377]|uniref:polyketide synthase dehydratase domain-containing protein n=1 Tax=Streptomyces sp. NPDC020377 TaxID=3365070 RepID=UPI0037896671